MRRSDPAINFNRLSQPTRSIDRGITNAMTVAHCRNLVSAYISRYRKKLKQAEKHFQETDCVETMHAIDSITYTLEVLEDLQEEMSTNTGS